MRAILIDPEARTVSEADYAGNHTDIYRLIDAPCFDAVRFDPERGLTGDVCYVDDEGLYREAPRHWFWIAGYYCPVVGRGLILGTTRNGDACPPRHTLEQITAAVEFGEPCRVTLPGTPARLLWVPARRGARMRSLEGL